VIGQGKERHMQRGAGKETDAASVAAALVDAASVDASHTNLAAALERGAVGMFQTDPLPIPAADDRAFLCEQRLRSSARPCIYLDLHTNRVRGFARQSAGHANRLLQVLTAAKERATSWLDCLLPMYRSHRDLVRFAYHPEEEATRMLEPTERNDLLHIDASPGAPTRGRRVLRLYVNLHSTDARVWHTSWSFQEILRHYGAIVGLTAPTGWWQPLHGSILRLLQAPQSARLPYDDFLERLQQFLKHYEPFQDRAPKRCWRFAPGVAWLLFTDGTSHAELRGRHVLEFTFLIPPAALACPEAAPVTLYERAVAAASALRAA
jgi:hypothetical protein